MSGITLLERRRCSAQRRLDRRLSAAERNRNGRFATPPSLADDMLALADTCLGPRAGVRFLDPALGTGVFFSSAVRTFGRSRIRCALGFEIDPQIAAAARCLWGDLGLEVRVEDFCGAIPARERANLVVCNPPYVRHHHLPAERKRKLSIRLEQMGFRLSGLAGLYAYFLLLADPWLCRGGVGVWIVPAELLDTRYGRAIKAYLAERVTLLRVHRFPSRARVFPDALVTPVVLAFRCMLPPPEHVAEFSAGETLGSPTQQRTVRVADLDPDGKWTGLSSARTPARKTAPVLRIGDLFDVRRGLATGANDFFILGRVEADRLRLPPSCLRPILPGPRLVPGDVIERDPDGFPVGIPHRVLLDPRLPIDRVRRRFPRLYQYLESGRRLGIDRRYLPRHRRPWYAQEHRPPAPILCTYMGRRCGGRFIRFIRNCSDATATNVYLVLYPRGALAQPAPEILARVFQALRGTEGSLASAGRTYAGGLTKVEPKELASVPLPPGVCDLVPGAGAR